MRERLNLQKQAKEVQQQNDMRLASPKLKGRSTLIANQYDSAQPDIDLAIKRLGSEATNKTNTNVLASTRVDTSLGVSRFDARRSTTIQSNEVNSSGNSPGINENPLVMKQLYEKRTSVTRGIEKKRA